MARSYCERCARPIAHCLCEYISVQQTALPIFLFQHTDESVHPYTTARLASLGAYSVDLHVGVQLEERIVDDWLDKHKASRPVVLYPPHNYAVAAKTAEGQALTAADQLAIRYDFDASCVLNDQPFDAVIVLDGTWRNTREMLLSNYFLCVLPTLTLMADKSSEYLIRKTNKPGGLSTIEAISKLLALAPEFDCDVYLKPMRKLVNEQLRYIATNKATKS